MGIANGTEWILFIVVIAVLIFGAKKVLELARSFGRATSEYEKARVETNREIQKIRGSESTI